MIYYYDCISSLLLARKLCVHCVVMTYLLFDLQLYQNLLQIFQRSIKNLIYIVLDQSIV